MLEHLFVVKSVDHKVSFLVLVELEVAAMAICGFVCIVILVGTNEGLAGPRVFLRELVGVAVPGDLVGSILVEILHSREGGDVEQVT